MSLLPLIHRGGFYSGCAGRVTRPVLT
jgi:hypothetical protein